MGDRWSYECQDDSLGETPTPAEVVQTLKRHQADGERYESAITGNYRPHFDDPVKGTAYLVRGIKKAIHEEGGQPTAVMETLSYIAQIWPTNDRGQPRWWTRDEAGKFHDAHAYVFSGETDPETFFEDPRPEWYKQEQAAEADKHEAQVKAAFWKCIQDTKGGIVFAHHTDVAEHRYVDIGPQRTKDYLRDWSAVELIEDPHHDGNGFPRKVFAVAGK